jgi:hypothetical protein
MCPDTEQSKRRRGKAKPKIPFYKLKNEEKIDYTRKTFSVDLSIPDIPVTIIEKGATEEESRLNLIWRDLSLPERKKILRMSPPQRLTYLRYLRNTTAIYPKYVRSGSDKYLLELAEHWCLSEAEIRGIVTRLDAGGRLPANIKVELNAFREIQARRVLESHELTRQEIERQIDYYKGLKGDWVEFKQDDAPRGVTTQKVRRESLLLELNKARDATYKSEADTLPMYIPSPVKETEVTIARDIENMTQPELEAYIAKAEKTLSVKEEVS